MLKCFGGIVSIDASYGDQGTAEDSVSSRVGIVKLAWHVPALEAESPDADRHDHG
jgi:hypothetical protein